MAHFETTPAEGFRNGSLLSNLISTLVAWRDARVTRKALAGLSDHELDDIGLCRGDIDGIAARGHRA